MTSHNSSTRSAHTSPSHANSPHSTSSSSSTRKHSSRRKASATGGSSRRGRAMPQRLQRSRSTRAMKWLEPRLLLITTGVTMFGALLQIVAISTDSWLVMEARTDAGHYRNATGHYVTEAYTGLWRLCRVELERKRDTAGQIVETTREAF
ncbi:hypothetical protein PoB_000841400 [Plakobranchus ocellatus]|uniref:Uncharacterized protein n=1 Tax=Plakobranchus ocellatus TaxID=259542 RepID=A0AAV3YIQ1_9GAST|nr:hypothetical protein PoB_000841400 [Plakobranchus ocellatus]